MNLNSWLANFFQVVFLFQHLIIIFLFLNFPNTVNCEAIDASSPSSSNFLNSSLIISKSKKPSISQIRETFTKIVPNKNLIINNYSEKTTEKGAKSNLTNEFPKRRIRLKRAVKEKTLNILALFELTQNNSVSLSGISEKVAAELAILDVNKNPAILNGYNLTMFINDTKCDSGQGVDALFHALYTKQDVKIISLLGTGSCNEVTERIAKIVPFFNIVQISYGSTSPTLSDRKKFPLFYRTVAPFSTHNEALIAFFHFFKWDQCAFFTKNENSFTLPTNFLVTELEKANITSKKTLTFSISDLGDQLKEMKESDSRIIIGIFESEIFAQLFCEVYKHEMYGRDYAWILLGKSNSDWLTLGKHWKDNLKAKANQQIYCSDAELHRAIENTIIVDRHNFLISNELTNYSSFAEEFQSRLKERNLTIISEFASYTYDAVYSIALALEKIRADTDFKLEKFTYKSENFSRKLMEEIGNLDFNGVSGPLSFSQGDRIGITSFMQIQDGIVVKIGDFFPRESELNFNCSGCRKVRWHSNQVPISRREFRFKRVRINVTTYVIVSSLAFLGIILATIFLGFNLYNRKLKYIKLSSPKLNNMVIFGSILAYLSVIFLGLEFIGLEPQHFAYICTVRAFLLSSGFSLSFGAIFGKTYRIHRIFTRGCIGVIRNKLLKDVQLMSLILVLLLIDVIIIISWSTFDPMQQNLRNLTLEIDPSDRSVVFQPQIEVCKSERGNVWMSILYGYKSLLLSVGLYMAWETRNVKVQVLNDSKYIGFCVYIVVLTSIVGVTLSNLLKDRVTLSYFSITTCILCCTTFTLFLLFLPKIHTIIKNPNGGGDPIVKSMGLKIEFNTRRFMVEDSKEEFFRAEVQNRVYKKQIGAIDLEISRLENLLSNSTSDTSLTIKKKLDDQKVENKLELVNPGSRSSSESETESDIQTIYLQGPRFIIPISLFNFETNSSINPSFINAITIARSSSSTKTFPEVKPPFKINSFENRLKCKKYLFKSEPKLFICDINKREKEPKAKSNEVLTEEDSSENNCIESNQIQPNNSSSISNIGSIRNLFRIPIKSYFKKTHPPLIPIETISKNSNESSSILQKQMSPSFLKFSQIKKQKYNSVPELYLRNSPILSHNRKKNSFNSDSVVDSSFIIFPPSSFDEISKCSNCTNSDSTRTINEQNILRLTFTGSESPYL